MCGSASPGWRSAASCKACSPSALRPVAISACASSDQALARSPSSVKARRARASAWAAARGSPCASKAVTASAGSTRFRLWPGEVAMQRLSVVNSGSKGRLVILGPTTSTQGNP